MAPELSELPLQTIASAKLEDVFSEPWFLPG